MERYDKSKAEDLHSDALCVGLHADNQKVHFKPFEGIGPRRFWDLFSLALSSGAKKERTNKHQNTINEWAPLEASMRLSNSSESIMLALVKALGIGQKKPSKSAARPQVERVNRLRTVKDDKNSSAKIVEPKK